jgi:endogenous inhibitor of DNA gyrase (YacG/DUF329 family)
MLYQINGDKLLTKCPKCGKEVDPKKNYKIAVRPYQAAESTDITFGMCEDCALILILEFHKPQ